MSATKVCLPSGVPVSHYSSFATKVCLVSRCPRGLATKVCLVSRCPKGLATKVCPLFGVLVSKINFRVKAEGINDQAQGPVVTTFYYIEGAKHPFAASAASKGGRAVTEGQVVTKMTSCDQLSFYRGSEATVWLRAQRAKLEGPGFAERSAAKRGSTACISMSVTVIVCDQSQ